MLPLMSPRTSFSDEKRSGDYERDGGDTDGRISMVTVFVAHAVSLQTCARLARWFAD